MAKVHDRIVEFSLTMNAAGDTVAVTAVKYYQNRGQLDAGVGLSKAFTGGSAGVSPKEIELGETLPPPTHVRFVFAAF